MPRTNDCRLFAPPWVEQAVRDAVFGEHQISSGTIAIQLLCMIGSAQERFCKNPVATSQFSTGMATHTDCHAPM